MASRVGRRKFLGAAAGVLAARGGQAPSVSRRLPATRSVRSGLPDVVVVGAGVFGACSAYFLRQAGFEVRLLDAFGVGHPRGTSAGETRLTRAGYGAQAVYTRWAWEALRDWKQWQKEWRTELFHHTGVLWLADLQNEYVEHSLRNLAREKIPVERLTLEELKRRFPQFAPLETRMGYFEPEGGVLQARKGCRAIVAAFERLGGRFQISAVEPPRASGPKLAAVTLRGSEEKIAGGVFVFACGPWLGELFPALLGPRIKVSKQEMFFFGTPPGSRDFESPRFPAWIDMDDRFGFYGAPSLDGRGLKIASDHSGPPFDPTNGDRAVSAEGLAAARKYLGERFPALKNAPLAETRVCQYERTANSHLVLDRHPEMENVWIAGGGSGHGFKLGPAVGRMVAARVADNRRDAIPPELRTLRH